MRTSCSIRSSSSPRGSRPSRDSRCPPDLRRFSSSVSTRGGSRAFSAEGFRGRLRHRVRGPLGPGLRSGLRRARRPGRVRGHRSRDVGARTRALGQGRGVCRTMGGSSGRQSRDRPGPTSGRRTGQPSTDVPASARSVESISNGLVALSPKQRDVVVLRYLVDLPEADVARAMQCSVGTVKTHASRGLAALRRSLEVAS